MRELPPGRERDEPEWRQLLTSAGFDRIEIIPTPRRCPSSAPSPPDRARGLPGPRQDWMRYAGTADQDAIEARYGPPEFTGLAGADEWTAKQVTPR